MMMMMKMMMTMNFSQWPTMNDVDVVVGMMAGTKGVDDDEQ